MSSAEDARSRPSRAKSTDIARWGAACAPCAAAKAKCSRSSSAPSGKCDRCERLFKHCTEQIHQPRRKRQSRPRDADAHRRLTGLLQALGETRDPSPSDMTSDVTCASTSLDPLFPQDRPQPLRRRVESPKAAGDMRGISIPQTYLSHAPTTCLCQPQSSICPSPTESDDALLTLYRNELTPLYPWVVVPSYVTARDLVQSRPFTMSAIRLVASLKDLRSMRGQLYQAMSYISDRMLIRAERSVDLLMGITVLLGWYHHHCIRHSQHNNLICLAQSLVADLGLNRHPYPAGHGAPERSNEERRLLLAVWYLSSSTGIHRLQIDTMRYTPYMEQCMRELLKANEYQTDEVMAHAILVQQLTEKIWRLTSPDYGTLNGIQGQHMLQGQSYTAMLGDELDKVIKDIPLHLKSNPLIISHINTATLRLHEAPLIDAAKRARIPGGFAILDPVATELFQGHFRRSTTVLKDWWEFWLSVPAPHYTRYPTPIFFHLIHGVAILNHWATFAVLHGLDDSDDVSSPSKFVSNATFDSGLAANDTQDTVRETIDVLGLGSSMLEFLHKFGDKCREASESLAGAPGVEPGAWDNNIWQQSERKTRSCRAILMKLAITFGHGPESTADSVELNDSDEFGTQSYTPEAYGSGLESAPYAGAVHTSSEQAYALQQAAVQAQWSWSSGWPVAMEPPDPNTWYGGAGATVLGWPDDTDHPPVFRGMGPQM